MLAGERLGDGEDSALRRRVGVGRAAASLEHPDRRHVDDRAAASLDHVGDGEAAAEVRALEVDADGALPHVLGQGGRWAVGLAEARVTTGEQPDAGVVVEHVDPTEGIHTGLDEALDLVGVRDIGLVEERSAAGTVDLLGHGPAVVSLHIRHHDCGAFRCEQAGGGGALTTTRPGDDGDLAVEPPHQPSPLAISARITPNSAVTSRVSAGVSRGQEPSGAWVSHRKSRTFSAT